MQIARVTLMALIVLAGGPAGAGACSLEIDTPASVRAHSTFSVTWSGDTGPQDPAVFGGFVVEAYLRSGSGGCPSSGPARDDRRQAVMLGVQNVLLAGPVRGASRVAVTRPGRYRVCGTMSRPGGGPITYERLVNGPVVRVRPARGTAPQRAPRPVAGTYRATAAMSAGGGPRASVTVVVAGDTITAAAVTDLQLSRCSDSVTPSQPQLNTSVDVASSGPARGLGSTLLGARISSSLPGPAPDGAIQIHGGFASSREIGGILTATTAAGVCEGSMAFTARR